MDSWDKIIHTALLGTGKRQLQKDDLSEDLADIFESMKQTGNTEEHFLNIASVALNYRKCGVQPFTKEIIQTQAEEEIKAYCSAQSLQVLIDILDVESQSLLELWVKECYRKNQIITPEYIPLLFNLGTRYKQLQKDIIAVTGKRGEWILPFNKTWNLKTETHNENIWLTGTLQERKSFLKELRQTEPRKARDLLREAWSQENANTKAELLKQLMTGISDEDLDWLEELMKEKSQKVKDEALKLLKLIPTSTIIQQYWEILKQSISVRKEKGLLGFGSKTVLDIQLISEIDEKIFETGIEKVSSEKGVTENDFIIYQLIAAIPTSFFEEQYQLPPKEILDLFNKSKQLKQFIPAFGSAAAAFKDLKWLKAVIAASDHQLNESAFKLLPENEIEDYALPFFDSEQTSEPVTQYLLSYYKKQWSVRLAKKILKHTAKNFYRYNHSFYKEQVLFIPEELISELGKLAPQEEYAKSLWTKTSEYITQILALKTRTVKAFQL